jgi:hypothetical protein
MDVDTGLLGLGVFRLFLGPWDMGGATAHWRPVDARLLGFRRRCVCLARRVLGPHIGFYGGVHYGFGYTGVGFVGGRWAGGVFAYNRSVTNVNVTIIHNTYNQTVVNNVNVTRVSYNGGAGIRAVPTAQERLADREQHLQPTAMQRQHMQRAQRNPALMASANHGHPTIAATPRAGVFKGPGVVHARGAAGRANGGFGQMRRNMSSRNAAHAGHRARRPAARHPGSRKRPPARHKQRQKPQA